MRLNQNASRIPARTCVLVQPCPLSSKADIEPATLQSGFSRSAVGQGDHAMGVETVLAIVLIVVLTFAVGVVLDRRDVRSWRRRAKQ